MLKFSEFINEAKTVGAISQLGIAITPDEEQEYRNIIAANKDNPNTPEEEEGTDDPTWQNTNAAVTNYVTKQVQAMRQQSGL